MNNLHSYVDLGAITETKTPPPPRSKPAPPPHDVAPGLHLITTRRRWAIAEPSDETVLFPELNRCPTGNRNEEVADKILAKSWIGRHKEELLNRR
jgi:hypothetical protein